MTTQRTEVGWVEESGEESGEEGSILIATFSLNSQPATVWMAIV